MTSSFFYRLTARRLAIASTGIGAAGFTANNPRRGDAGDVSAAEEQFHTSSAHPVPLGWTGEVWKIRNDYPNPTRPASTQGVKVADSPMIPGPELPLPGRGLDQEAPWLKVDFRSDPERYCQLVKEYCWEGNENNGFVVQRNKIRNWYHAPWMHYSSDGREPLNGLTFERATPPYEFSRTQHRYLQTWACSYYNNAGASLFGSVWGNPSTPQWDKDQTFPLGTCVFKVLMTDATDQELPNMAGSPSMKAVIAPAASDPTKNAADPAVRNPFASDLRLLQVDFAVRDDRAPIGWIFGTFMYTGTKHERNAWNRIIPVGIMWGNDPLMNQAAFDQGSKPAESWINPEAETLRISLAGSRPSWGWNGRLNGPADNFISSCASCHSVAQKTGESDMTQPEPKLENGKYIPINDSKTMNWFRNVPAGQPFTPGSISGDYSLQLMIGFHNYQAWVTAQRGSLGRFMTRTKYIFSGKEQLGGTEKREGLRNGPDMRYDQAK